MKPTNSGGVMDTPVIEITQKQMAWLLDKVCVDWRNKLVSFFGAEIIHHGHATVALSRAKKLIEEGKPEKEVLYWIYKQWPVLKEEEIEWDKLCFGSIVELNYSESIMTFSPDPQKGEHFMLMARGEKRVPVYVDEGLKAVDPGRKKNDTLVFLSLNTGKLTSFSGGAPITDIVAKVIEY